MVWEPRLPIPNSLGTGTREKAAEGKECDQHSVGLLPREADSGTLAPRDWPEVTLRP